MQRVIRKRIRGSGGGVDIAADVNVVIATGERGKTHTVASSHQRVEQRSGPAPGSRTAGKPDKEDR